MPTSRSRIRKTAGVIQTGPRSNLLIQGGEFTQINQAPNVADDAAFKKLQGHVATTAYATRQEGDAPKCHPNTRTAILNAIMHWVLVATMGVQWILWINGAAGAGKSAIARSVVDLCLEQQVIIARFFFFRTDTTRNTIKPVVSTLVYQLIKSVPALKPLVIAVIKSDPLIFKEPLETQFEVLIFEPLHQLHKKYRLQKAIVFLVDGVDECSGDSNQTRFIHTIARFIEKKSVPLIAIFASRTEPQLKMAFNELKVDKILRRLPLDTDYCADGDIWLFPNDSFAKIKRTHPFKSLIPSQWPSPLLLQEIIDKSSNQFIYASVVSKFISSPRLHPVQQLEIVHGIRPAGELTPFAQLDALYQHIFSQVQNITRVTEILEFCILRDFPFPSFIGMKLNITYDDICIALEDLTSVLSCNEYKITFLHASLPDFLLDQSRAQQYYMDKGLWCEQRAIECLRKGPGYLMILHKYLSWARCTPQLQEALYTFQSLEYFGHVGSSGGLLAHINIVHEMDIGDNGALYHHQLDLIVRQVHKRWPNKTHQFSEKHDIEGILNQIKSEEAVIKRTEATFP